ncbi:MAG: hypothetical protein AAFV71_30830 [Cyanobacteria bacterium J06633_8]
MEILKPLNSKDYTDNILYKKYPTAAKAASVKKWINWVMTKGQSFNGKLLYTSIPTSVRRRVIKQVNSQVK